MSREQMKARLEAATPGPWEWDDDQWLEPNRGGYVLSNDSVVDKNRVEPVTVSPENATLIAHAPTDLAKLHAALDAVEALADMLDAKVVIASENPAAKSHVAKRIREAIRDAIGEDQ